MDKIEKKVADTILQKSDPITIGGRAYQMPPATPATLIMVSEFISDLPNMDAKSENILMEVLSKAQDCRAIGLIAAVLVLGAKQVKRHKLVRVKEQKDVYRFSFRKMARVIKTEERWRALEELDFVADTLMQEHSVKALSELISSRLAQSQISHFFGLTTSLSEANILKQTREVETVSGE